MNVIELRACLAQLPDDADGKIVYELVGMTIVAQPRAVRRVTGYDYQIVASPTNRETAEAALIEKVCDYLRDEIEAAVRHQVKQYALKREAWKLGQ